MALGVRPTAKKTGLRAIALAGAALLALGVVLAPAPGAAQSAAPKGAAAKGRGGDKQPYVILRADEATYDENSGLVTAKGKVEIAHGDQILQADTVIYDEANDKITAIGNVVLMESTGDVRFADKAEFSNGMRDGFATGFRMLLADNTRIAAASGARTGGIVTTMDRAVFSPCNLCKENPRRPPLWRLRSVKVTHDSAEKTIEYKDAFLEFYGIPVFYTPYMSHPDPSVKRRSGFLTPSYGSNSDFGYVLKAPYFWAISPSEDLTVSPQFMTDTASVLGANYRRRFADAEVEIDGSVTQPEREDDNKRRVGGTDTRGHFFAKGKVNHDPIWRTKFQLQHASDDTYLRRYNFPLPDAQTLTTSFNTEGFKGRNYAQMSGYSFQGLRATDDPGASPLVLPFAEYNFVSEPEANGSYFSADTSLLAINRDQGTDSRRLAFGGGWHLPYKAWTGEVYRLSALMRTDIYHADQVAQTDGSSGSGVSGRFLPQLMAEYRYPFVRSEGNATQVIEPVAAVVLAPNGGNPSKIPNEDSRDVEFDDTNLFDANRFTGVDRVESGTRFVYGLNWGLYGNQGGAIEAFGGQSYRLRPETQFSTSSGLRDQASDLVGRLRISPSSWFDLLYRFRLDPDTIEARRHQAGMTFGPQALKFGVSYLFLDETTGSGTFTDREELYMSFNAKLTDRWSASGHRRDNLATGGGKISEGLGLVYKDECFTFIVQGQRTFTTDRDLRPTDSLMFLLIFKHLGEFESRR